MKRFIALLLTLLICLALTVPAFAAEDSSGYGGSILDMDAELEQKYGVSIVYPSRTDGSPAITMNNLETLNRAFSNLGGAMVREVSRYYERRGGSKLRIEYVFSGNSYEVQGGVLMAAFEHPYARITVYLPRASGQAIISGENPIALVHEFGHAFHIMCHELRGPDGGGMRSDWLKINEGHVYDPALSFYNPDEDVFVSGYAASSFEEDFAETFGHAFARNTAGTGFSERLVENGFMTPLGQKIEYIRAMLETHISNHVEAVQNFDRVYNTEKSYEFEGNRFSGEYLQYMGYPQPRNILGGILNQLRLVSEGATWVRRLGAWRVNSGGRQYFIFPGGTWMNAA
jgi:hypothetical protein